MRQGRAVRPVVIGTAGGAWDTSGWISAELTGDPIELVREVSDSFVVVVVEAPPGLDAETSIEHVLFDGPRGGSIGGEFGIERVGDIAQRVVADEIGHLEWSEHGDEGTQRGLNNRIKLERVGRADVNQMQHLA